MSIGTLMTGTSFECAQCSEAKTPEHFGRKRNGMPRTTCRACMGQRIADAQWDRDDKSYLLNPNDDEPLHLPYAPDVPYIRYPDFDHALVTMLDRLTCTWGTHGETR